MDNISSEYIHQAIIILKSYPPGQHDKIIAEAERIVSSYFDRSVLQTENRGKNNVGILKGIIIALSIALSVCSYFAFFH